MSWVDIKSTTYKGAYYYQVSPTVTLKYDDSSITPESIKVRFSATLDKRGWNDGFYILWAPGTDTEKIITVKPVGSDVLKCENYTITLTKASTSTVFEIPEYWLCHTGSSTPDANGKLNYGDYGLRTFYWYFDSSRTEANRKNFKTVVASSTISGPTPVTAGSVTITDNGNNTFTIIGYKGAKGENNKINKSILEWTVHNENGDWYEDSNGNYPTQEFTGSSYKLENKSLSSYKALSTAAVRRVAARVNTDGEYNDASTSFTYADINQYIGPYGPSNVQLEYSKSRLTIKEKWVLKWTAGGEVNKVSPVIGYRIRMIVNGNYKPIFDSAGRQLSSQSGSDYYYDTENTLTSLDIWPGLHEVKPGDTIRFNIFAYTKNAKGDQYWSGSGETPAESSTYTVQNAGIVRVKVGGSWKEGQVYVKVNGSWKEAETVNIKTSTGWKESQ